MTKASRLFSDGDRQTIAAAVTEAERRTSGEIVPVVATASGRYDRAEDLFGIVVALVALVVAWIFFQDIQPIEGDWASGQALALGLIPILLITLVGFALGAALASWVTALRRPLISRREMREEVERAAAEAFQRFRVRRTAEGTGILIYVSLHERMVRVVGDDTIAEKLGQGDWQTVCDLIVEGMRSGRPAEGLAQGIAKCGEMLSQHFPIAPDDTDELTNELQIID